MLGQVDRAGPDFGPSAWTGFYAVPKVWLFRCKGAFIARPFGFSVQDNWALHLYWLR